MKLLVGDNPFHGVSHLSQMRSRDRGTVNSDVEYCSELVRISLENGADGFMFSVSDTTLSILRILRQKGKLDRCKLYAIVPYAYEYVRLATQTGGISGLAKKLAKQALLHVNIKAIAFGIKGFVQMDPEALLKTYLAYEISRMRSAIGRKTKLDSLLLHEIVTEMMLAFNLDWLCKAYIESLSGFGIRPGFETRNYAYLVGKFQAWGIDLSDVAIAAPFNVIGFQMNPSRAECERALEYASKSETIGFSIMAAGLVKPKEAMEYILTLPNLKGVAVGVSKDEHARNTFRILKEQLDTRKLS